MLVHHGSAARAPLTTALVIAATLALVACGGTSSTPTTPSTTLDTAPFEAHLAEYLDSDYTDAEGLKEHVWLDSSDYEQQGYVRGKLVIVDAASRALDYVFLTDLGALSRGPTEGLLPQSLIAATPEEAGTVVLLEPQIHEDWTYTDGAKAYSTDLRVRVVDFVEKKVVSVVILLGETPPMAKSGEGDVTMGRDDAVLRAYLQGLPAWESSGSTDVDGRLPRPACGPARGHSPSNPRLFCAAGRELW